MKVLCELRQCTFSGIQPTSIQLTSIHTAGLHAAGLHAAGLYPTSHTSLQPSCYNDSKFTMSEGSSVF